MLTRAYVGFYPTHARAPLFVGWVKLGEVHQPTVMWGLSDSAYKNTSIHDGLIWSEIIPKKKSPINKNGGQSDVAIAYR